ncbi:glutamate-cysteine ligase family protein [Micromonospora palomenae]|uniref:glutamate-cysteine ligase family protein n=1 Tax=Micromonospora palomenae TaxID=1461247 RepID=UPI001B8809CE
MTTRPPSRPVQVAAFANSPIEDGRPSGCLSTRQPVSETSRCASSTSRPDQVRGGGPGRSAA